MCVFRWRVVVVVVVLVVVVVVGVDQEPSKPIR